MDDFLLRNYIKFEEIKELNNIDLEIAKEFAKIVEKLGYKVLYIHNFENVYWYDYKKQKVVIYNLQKEEIEQKVQNCLIVELWNSWQLIIANGD